MYNRPATILAFVFGKIEREREREGGRERRGEERRAEERREEKRRERENM